MWESLLEVIRQKIAGWSQQTFCLFYLKQTFLPIIWIFTEGEGIESRLILTFSTLMQNNRLGIHSDKIGANSNIQITLKYLTTYSADLPNGPKYFWICVKQKLSLGIRSPCLTLLIAVPCFKDIYNRYVYKCQPIKNFILRNKVCTTDVLTSKPCKKD